MLETKSLPTRAIALAAACLICWAGAACGDSGDERASGTGTAHTTPAPRDGTSPAPQPGDGASPPSDRAPGDNGSGADGPSGGESSDAPDPTPRDTTESGDVAAVVEGMYADIAAGDAAGVCSAMSREARRQIAQNVPGGSTKPPARRTCVESFSKFLEATDRNGGLDGQSGAKVEKVSIAGSTATVTVSFGPTTGSVQLVKENGHWKFGVGAFGGGAGSA